MSRFNSTRFLNECLVGALGLLAMAAALLILAGPA